MLVAVNAIIKDTETYNGAFAFVGMLFYALELYADFTGGIDITIGTAQTLGITVTENFNRPYFSKSIKEYWKRWHITMGTWFTDYIFYPLSICKSMQKLSKFSRKHFGEQIGKRIPVYLASFIVWFTTGIWHGANWNFIAWGIGNFVVIMISQELEPLYYRFHSRFRVQGKTWFKIFQVVRTVLIMSCLRMFDCYRDVPLTFKMFGSMFTKFSVKSLTGAAFLGLGLTVWDYAILLVGALLLFTVSMLGRSGSVREKLRDLPFRYGFLSGTDFSLRCLYSVPTVSATAPASLSITSFKVGNEENHDRNTRKEEKEIRCEAGRLHPPLRGVYYRKPMVSAAAFHAQIHA